MIYSLTRTWPGRMQKLAEWTAGMMGDSVETSAMIGCSPAAVVAQAAQETGWGAAAIGNNLFGIKADATWKGARVLQQTWEHESGSDVPQMAWFRDYPTRAAGIMDHFLFLKENSRYAAAGVFDPDGTKSDREYFEALQRAGYATDPNYAERLCDVLDTVNLFTPWMVTSARAPQLKQNPAPRLLLIGCHGADVEALQTVLKAGGYYTATVDGDFGPRTRQAVMAFQAAHPACNGVDGIVGTDTRAVLGLA